MSDFDFLNPYRQDADAAQPAAATREAPGRNGINRRDFFRIGAAATGGLLVAVSLPGFSAADHAAPAASFQPNVFVRIDPDDAITITIPMGDMGQGVRTSLAMILAEEMDVDWQRVQVEQAPFDSKYGGQGTGGSGTVRSRWRPFREAGAAVRASLIQAAAETWRVQPSACYAEEGTVIHRPDGRRLRYGQLAATAARLPVPEQAPLKDPKDFRIVGNAKRGLDVPDIVTGRAVYGMDVTVPGMLYAVVERSPVFGGRVARFDDSRTKTIPGVRAVVEVPAVGRPAYVPSGVAIVAENTWAALAGRKALQITWEGGPNAQDSTEGFRVQMEALTGASCREVHNTGDAEAALAAGSHRIEASYALPFLAHATMEPMNCTAHVQGDRCEIWAPTQNPNAAADRVAEALGIPKESVSINITLMGGGFGRRLWSDFVAEAALVSKAVGAPVKVTWTREDDMQHGFYRPAVYHRMEAVLDEQGAPAALRHRIASTSIAETTAGPDANNMHGSEVGGAADVPYRVPNRRCEFANVSAAVTRGWWRSVAHSHTTFAVESFIDELAAAAGRDPYQYRLDLIDTSREVNPDHPYALNPARLKAVLQLAAEKAGWGEPLPAGHGLGIACQFSFATYCAEVVEVSIGADGNPKVHRVVAAVDCGTVVNPTGAVAQVEGSIIDGLSAALMGRITVKDGRVEQGNFHDYPLMRMGETPGRIDVHFVQSDAAPTGLGEPALPPIGPALANAIFAATGKRIRTLPVQPELLRG